MFALVKKLGTGLLVFVDIFDRQTQLVDVFACSYCMQNSADCFSLECYLKTYYFNCLRTFWPKGYQCKSLGKSHQFGDYLKQAMRKSYPL